jgi:hypothetical protein
MKGDPLLLQMRFSTNHKDSPQGCSGSLPALGRMPAASFPKYVRSFYCFCPLNYFRPSHVAFAPWQTLASAALTSRGGAALGKQIAEVAVNETLTRASKAQGLIVEPQTVTPHHFESGVEVTVRSPNYYVTKGGLVVPLDAKVKEQMVQQAISMLKSYPPEGTGGGIPPPDNNQGQDTTSDQGSNPGSNHKS